MTAPYGPRIVRRELPGKLSAADVLALVRNDEHPFALIGAWAGGGALVGSQPVALAGPPEPIDQVLGGAASAASGGGWPGLPSFGGGWIGYLGYGALEAAPRGSAGEAGALPAWWLACYDHVLVQ